MSIERLQPGIYLCSPDETAPLLPAIRPDTKDGDYRTWYCTCGEVVEYKRDEICPKCHRRIDWKGK